MRRAIGVVAAANPNGRARITKKGVYIEEAFYLPSWANGNIVTSFAGCVRLSSIQNNQQLFDRLRTISDNEF